MLFYVKSCFAFLIISNWHCGDCLRVDKLGVCIDCLAEHNSLQLGLPFFVFRILEGRKKADSLSNCGSL